LTGWITRNSAPGWGEGPFKLKYRFSFSVADVTATLQETNGAQYDLYSVFLRSTKDPDKVMKLGNYRKERKAVNVLAEPTERNLIEGRRFAWDPSLNGEKFGCDLIVEVIEVSYAQTITRTIGFWQTHTAFTSSVFQNNLAGTMNVGAGSHVRTITNLPGNGQSKLFGAFYSSIPKKTNNSNRTALDKARMQLLQQLVAAKLNCAAFGCTPATQGIITNADTAYASGTAAQMNALTGQLDTYNNSGDANAIPSTLGSIGSATPATSQARANKVFWDSP